MTFFDSEMPDADASMDEARDRFVEAAELLELSSTALDKIAMAHYDAIEEAETAGEATQMVGDAIDERLTEREAEAMEELL